MLAGLFSGRRFDPSLVRGVGERCRFGGVRVLVCAPETGAGEPFPTTFWLVCPWLVRRAGAVESEGGVRELEGFLAGREGSWGAYGRLHQELRLGLLGAPRQRFLRRFRPRAFARLRRGGVGGILSRDGIRVKCVHLQTASWLALGFHPGAEWLEEKGLGEDCGGTRLCGGCASMEEHFHAQDRAIYLDKAGKRVVVLGSANRVKLRRSSLFSLEGIKLLWKF